jgi:imidazolonepropionase-like amidohydrolase
MKLFLCAAAATLLATNVAHSQTVAITGATIYQTPERKLSNATLVFRNGVIVAVGERLAAPAGARIIDGSNRIVTAGLIDGASLLGLVEVDQEASGNDGRFSTGTGSDAVHAAFRVTDAFDSRSVAIPIARTGGVTSVIVRPAGGLLAGTAAWMSLADGVSPAPPVLANVAMAASLGNQALSNGSRGYAIATLRELLDDAAAFGRNQAAFDRNQSRRMIGSRDDLVALQSVLSRTLPLLIRADAEVNIRAALTLAKERNINIIIEGGAEAWRVAKELAKAQVPVLVDPTLNLPDDLSAVDVRNDNLAVLDRAGVEIVISTLGSSANTRTLRQLAGIGVSYGLTWSQAFAAITASPAHVFSIGKGAGKSDRGTLEVGKIADIVIWTGDPLELSTTVSSVIINGIEQSMQSHQQKLLERYRKVGSSTK